MTIEDNLKRIADATESIAKSLELMAIQSAVATPQDIVRDQAPKTRPGKKVEEKVEEGTEEELGGGVNEADSSEDMDPIKWPELNKKLFGMLNAVRDATNQQEAKAVCAKLMKKYTGGKQFSESAVDASKYRALLNDIEAELEALNG